MQRKCRSQVLTPWHAGGSHRAQLSRYESSFLCQVRGGICGAICLCADSSFVFLHATVAKGEDERAERQQSIITQPVLAPSSTSTVPVKGAKAQEVQPGAQADSDHVDRRARAGQGLEERCCDIARKQGQASAEWNELRCACMVAPTMLESLDCFLQRSKPLDESELDNITQSRVDVVTSFEHTKEILSYGTRVPGDAGWQRTVDYIERHMGQLGWALERDSFVADTPQGRKTMHNIIASVNPQAGVCLLDLAAHFETKFFSNMEFLGATDSAAPVGLRRVVQRFALMPRAARA